ncbi:MULTISPECIES: UDP-glucose dehydrogenase family protein [Peribacillus]|uniref:UDP-glucose dehydrogenase family protein n=1 Tax=Peribacillus TaxID=2675229 RepID=UPI001F4ED450|nr:MULTISPECIES: UDP-glucose/GDP-mannose dehydrogenase family protein [unclassified Peribacillus]MCK1981937.1 UDP-glucose/GDP-mannose dehydrogenase family protein [Peribacillus sp. Aquil_B1]MCK2010019.1 UDP-glucose/GDP-mannose dehydrogenase family protein [Peribacillus sp. Aquil_B8]
MKITVVGTGYVGLVTGTCLSEIGHTVTCIDIDQNKVNKMRAGISPIFEPGLDELMIKNLGENRLFFTTNHEEGFEGADVIYIAVGTPEKEDGSANLSYIEQVARDIATHIKSDVIVVTKSTVPVGTNDWVKEVIQNNLVNNVNFEIVSNPEFLREGAAIFDSFNGDRIVVGSDNGNAAKIIEEINKPFGIPVFKTDIRSAEMIKYAANAFLATKISFINEISNLCEKIGANVEDVANGMGQDNRIGSQFLNAGIGYGGSCFPKDTKALVNIAGNVEYDFELLKGVIRVNQKQQEIILSKLEERFGNLEGLKVAILGLSFKPNTDDMRESASIIITKHLIDNGANVVAYDPVSMENAKRILDLKVNYVSNTIEALKGADAVLILTEWNEFKDIDLGLFVEHMKFPVIFDGRNCFDLKKIESYNVEYHSMGRPSVRNIKLLSINN